MKKDSSHKTSSSTGYRVRSSSQDSRISENTQHNNTGVLIFLVSIGAMIGLSLYAGYTHITSDRFLTSIQEEVSSFFEETERKFVSTSEPLTTSTTVSNTSTFTNTGQETVYSNSTYNFSLQLPPNTQVESRSYPDYTFTRFRNYRPSAGSDTALGADEYYLELYIYSNQDTESWLTSCRTQLENPTTFDHRQAEGSEGMTPDENNPFNQEYGWCFTQQKNTFRALAGEGNSNFEQTKEIMKSISFEE